MKKINCKSDFDFILRLRDCKGDEIGWPEFDWHARLWTTQKANSIAVSCTKGEPTNCFNDNGSIHIVMNNHRLGAGVLNIEFTAILPNSDYPDDNERIVTPLPLEIELIRAAAPCPESFEIEAVLPVVKGKPFTYDDFTPEQIAELRRPATEAADAVNTLAADERRAERLRVAAEEKRVKAETLRASAETARAANERQRVADERARVEAEDERREAERQRAETFAGYADVVGTVNGKADRSELSNILAVDPLGVPDTPELPGYRRLLVDMWNEAVGSSGGFDMETGQGYLNGFTDIGFPEMEAMLDAYYSGGRYSLLCRTNIPMKLYYNQASADPQRYTNTHLQVIKEPRITGMGTDGCKILNSHTIREIGNVWIGDGGNNRIYIQSSGLEYIGMAAQNANAKPFPQFFIGNASRFRLDGMAQILRWVKNSTVTVHKDVYAKLTGDTANAAAAALTPGEQEQWRQVMVDAAGKNITFATT